MYVNVTVLHLKIVLKINKESIDEKNYNLQDFFAKSLNLFKLSTELG